MRKHLITLAVTAALLAGASSASANYNVSVSPGGTTAGTAGASQITFNTARRTISCTTTGFGARYISGTFNNVPPGFAFSDSTNIQLTFSGCTINGPIPVTITCTRTTRFNTQPPPTTGGQTTISITAIACAVAVTGAPTCSVNVTGGVLGNHDNLLGRITVSTTGQTLTATGSTCGALPNDTSVTLSSTSGLAYRESPTQRIDVT